MGQTTVMAVDRPTWVQPGPRGQFVYVACNASDQVKVVDLERWEVVETFATGGGPYNIDLTDDGRLMVVTPNLKMNFVHGYTSHTQVEKLVIG